MDLVLAAESERFGAVRGASTLERSQQAIATGGGQNLVDPSPCRELQEQYAETHMIERSERCRAIPVQCEYVYELPLHRSGNQARPISREREKCSCELYPS